MNKTYVLEKKMNTLDNEVITLKNVTKPIIEVKDQET